MQRQAPTPEQFPALLNEEQFAGGIPQKINDRIAAKAKALNLPVPIAAPRQVGSPTQAGKFSQALPFTTQAQSPRRVESRAI